MTICHCIEKSMLQTYQWDIQFEMQYCQDPQASSEGESGALVRPQCHEMVCVRLAKRLVCQVKVCVCENWGKPRGERRSGQGPSILGITLAISQACMFLIFTKNLLFILVNFFSDLCTKHSQVSSYELVIESEYHFSNGNCVTHSFSVTAY